MTRYVKADLLTLFETHRVAKRRIKHSYAIYVTLTVLWIIFAIIPGATMKYVTLTTATVALITIGYNTFEKKRLVDTNNAIIDKLIVDEYIKIKTEIITHNEQTPSTWYKRIFGEKTLPMLRVQYPTLHNVTIESVEVTYPEFYDSYQHIINQLGWDISNATITLYDQDNVIIEQFIVTHPGGEQDV